MKRVYCLYRVSTTKQVDHNEQGQADIPMQRSACWEFADKKGWSIIREEREDGISGFKVSATQRDKIQLIKSHAEQGKFDILLVFMFDRIGRRAEETPFVVEWLVEHGIEVWSVVEGEQRFDSHMDYLMNYIRYWQAGGESKKTSVRTKTAMQQMVMAGRFRGGQAPYGYRLEKSGIQNKRKHEVFQLKVDNAEAEVVQLIFDTYLKYGYGRYRIASFLNERGVRNRKGENWHESTIGAMLRNIIYKGILRSGTAQSSVISDLVIVDANTFDLVQRLMAERRSETQESRTIPLNTKGQSLLSGNVFCGHCGGRLILTTSSSRGKDATANHSSSKRIRYVCYNKTRHRKECDGQTCYTMHYLDDAVTEVIHSLQQTLTHMAETTPSDNKLEKLLIIVRMFDIGNQEMRKMIAGYLMTRVTVYRGYQLKIEYSPAVQHYLSTNLITSDDNQNDKENINKDLLSLLMYSKF